jgi:phosphatidylserine/phosphatidylglycerophosphate/cardiolipin synthase-like enzyme
MLSVKLVLGFLFGLLIGLSASVLLSFENISCVSCNSGPISISENQITALTDQQYFETVYGLISSANESVHIVMFEVKYYPDYPESHESLILQKLIELKSKGVDVKIIADEYLTEKEAVNYLGNNGIGIKYDSESRTTHSKLLIIDGKIVIIGSTNWSYYAIDKNREANVVIYSTEAAQRFEKYFEDVWENL